MEKHILKIKSVEKDIFQSKETLHIKGTDYTFYSLFKLLKQGYNIEELPFSIRILLKNALRNCDEFRLQKKIL